ncbi:MAG TPA: hypothetical protein VNA69_13045 [Thermoanaerobaculia bacterium]|nr:hypothetical protein [Thermoanaerobaculia bacterium]
MRARLLLLLILVFSANALLAKEIFLAVSGTANNVFFSDARVFNPTDHEISVQAYYLPRGNNSNAAEQPVTFTVATRQMKVFDDVVLNLLQRGDVGGIRFVSADDFVVTQRVYARLTPCAADKPAPCTLGQFVQGQDLTAAIKNGVILQLKLNSAFRTNIGAANPNNVPASVTWRLYDKNNALIATSASPVVMPPYAVIGPTSLDSSFFYSVPAGSDLSDAWVGFTSDQPIFAYGSVVDNSSTDQTYVPASADSGTAPAAPQNAVMTISARNFEFTTTTDGTLKANEQVTFKISATEGLHGFQLVDPSGDTLITIGLLGSTLHEHTITLPEEGTYQFFCTNSGCGAGHFEMIGSFAVGATGNPGGPGRY